MSKQRKFVLISSAIGFISMFLPWASISMFGYSQSVNGMHDKGIIVFICFVVSGLIAVFDEQTKNLDKTKWAVTLLAGAVALLVTIWFYSQATNSIMGSSLVGFGVYIAAIAAIGILASAYLFKLPEDNLKDGFNSMKRNIESKIGSGTTDATNPSNSSSLIEPPPSAIAEDENIKPVL